MRVNVWMAALLSVAGLGAAGRPALAEELAQAGAVPLIEAVKKADTQAVLVLLGQQTDVNASEPDGTTALHWAVQRDDLDTANLLIRAGANIRTANRYGVTPLMVASANGTAAIIEVLLKAGADANSAGPEGETVLMTAARTGRPEAVKALLAHGANVNAKESWRGQTALMWAAAENHAAAVEALVDAGADVQARSNGGFTALLFAVRAGSMDAIPALLAAGANVNDTIKPPASGSAMAPTPAPAGVNRVAPPQAGAQGQQANAQTQARRGAAAPTGNRGARARDDGTSALVLAVLNAHFELAALLLDHGADPNAAEQGWTALHQVAWTRKPPIQHGLPPAVETGKMDSLEFAKTLLAHGADPNARQTKEPNDGARNLLNRAGSTPFLQAAKLGDVEYMRLLAANGADPSLTTDEGATPLMAAAGVGIWKIGESAGTNEEVFETVKLAYELGNDVNAADANGDTALHGAVHRGANEIVQFLVDNGARMNVSNKIGWTPWLIADGVFYPNTFNRHLDTAELLLRVGADPKVGKRRPEDLVPLQQLTAAPAQQRPGR